MKRGDDMTARRATFRPGRRGMGWVLWLALLPIASAQPRTRIAPPAPPQVLSKDLCGAVQTARIYPDGKAVPDATPTAAPADILKQYHAERPDSPAAVKAFVEAHFTLPSEVAGAPPPSAPGS